MSILLNPSLCLPNDSLLNGPPRLSRQQRHRLYKSKMRDSWLPEDIRELYRRNPNAHGLPRAFKLHFDETEEENELAPLMSRSNVTFGSFGTKECGLMLDGNKIDPTCVEFQNATNSCTFQSQLSLHVDGEAKLTTVAGYFNFDLPTPSGSLEVDSRLFRVSLAPQPLNFTVKVSQNDDAYWNSGKNELVWNDQGEKWKKASWESSMRFGYRTIKDDDPIEPRVITENYFTDTMSNPWTLFNLTQDSATRFTCTVQQDKSNGNIIMQTIVEDDPPTPPPERKDSPVKSVFPSHFVAHITPFGDSFTGAYRTKDGLVFAVQGEVMDDDDNEDDNNGDDDKKEREEELIPLLPMLASAKPPPVEDINDFLNDGIDGIPSSEHDDTGSGSNERKDAPMYSAPGYSAPAYSAPIYSAPMYSAPVYSAPVYSAPMYSAPVYSAPMYSAPPMRTALPPANINLPAVLGNDPMIKDEKDPTGYSDVVAKSAMDAFQKIIVYYMDDDLRKTFIGPAPNLDPEVKAIADQDKENTSTFYKSLQVPYLTTMLANSKQEEGKKCNGARAERLLREIPAENEVYKKQTSDLYRHFYLKRFPATVKLLQDQRSKDYSAEIDKITTQMKMNLARNTNGLATADTEGYAARIKKVKGSIDQLGKWAKQERLYWAFRLLYWTEKVSLPTWYSLHTQGNTSSSIAMNFKKLNGLFEVLEDNKINKTGQSFTEAFNDMIRAFQMQAIIPQLIDLDGNYGDFDSILKESLQQYYNTYKDKVDPKIAEQMQHVKQLYQDDKLRQSLLLPLRHLGRVTGAAKSWNVMMEKWEELVRGSKFFKGLKFGSKVLASLQVFTAATLLLLPLIPGFFAKLDTTQKAIYSLAITGVVGAVFIKIAQGAFRLYHFWSQISGWKDVLKTLVGFEKVVDKIPQAANKISGTFGRWFARTARQTAALAEEETALAFGRIRNFSRMSKLFGRNVGELMGTVAGFLLSAACLVMSAIDLSKEKEPLLIAVDVLMILSSAVQILAFVAGWVLAFGASTMVSTLTLVATWGGPLGLVLALVGVIILIVWMSTHKEENPVENFVNTKVKEAGLYMDYKAIDYLVGVAATETTASRQGVSVYWQATGKYIRLDSADEDTGRVNSADNLDYTTDTVWSLQTNGKGKTQIFTHKYYPGDGMRTVWFLSLTDDESAVCVRKLPDKKSNFVAYRKAQKLTFWTVTVVADPVEDPDTKTPTSALCRVAYTNTDGSEKFVLGMDEKGPALTSGSKLGSFNYSRWLFELDSLGPVSFQYNNSPWTINTSQKNEKNRAFFEDPLATSQGYKWSIDPPLDSAVFELVTTAGNDEGTIQMKDGVTPKIMSKTTYTVTCIHMAKGQPHGGQKATVEIEVVDAEKQLAGEDI